MSHLDSIFTLFPRARADSEFALKASLATTQDAQNQAYRSALVVMLADISSPSGRQGFQLFISDI